MAYSINLFIYFFCRPIVEPPEVLVFHNVPKVCFYLDGTFLAFEDPLSHSGCWHWILLSVLPIVR